MINFFKQLFCRHDYIMIGDYNLTDSDNSDGQIIIRDHECKKCKKVTPIVSGLIL